MISSYLRYVNQGQKNIISMGAVALYAMMSSPVPSFALEADKTPSIALAPVKASTLISLEFARVSIPDALSMVSKQGGLSLVVGEDVHGTLPSIYLEDVTPEDAIRYIALAGRLTWKKLNAKTYLVMKAAPSNEISTEVSEAARPANNEFDPDQDFKIFTPSPPVASTRSVSNLNTVQLKNIKPSTMAYWLDPKNQKLPIENVREAEAEATAQETGRVTRVPRAENVNTSNSNQMTSYSSASNQVTGGQGGGSTSALPSSGGTVALPDGVDNLIAVDSLNVLLVRGTDEGVDRLREVIALLDRPIAQIEIEAQFVSVAVQDVNQFQLDFNNPGSNAPDSIIGTPGRLAISGRVGNFRANLLAVLSNGRTKVVTSPRVTTFNNQAASLVSQTRQTIFIRRVTLIPGNNGNNPTQQVDFDQFDLNTGTVLTVVPTLLKDGTINITLRPDFSIAGDGFQATPDAPVIPSVLQQVITTSANIKDGDTLAIGGLRTTDNRNNTNRIPFLSKIPIVGGLFKGKSNRVVETELIIFVTARVVRRIDDPIPGT